MECRQWQKQFIKHQGLGLNTISVYQHSVTDCAVQQQQLRLFVNTQLRSESEGLIWSSICFFRFGQSSGGRGYQTRSANIFPVFTSSPIEVFLEIPFLARISGLTVKLSCCPTSGLHWATTCGSLGGVNALPQFWVLWLWRQERNLPSSEVFKQHTQQGAHHDPFMFVMMFAVLYTTCWLYVVCWLEPTWPTCSKHRKLISKYCIVGDKFDKVSYTIYLLNPKKTDDQVNGQLKEHAGIP